MELAPLLTVKPADLLRLIRRNGRKSPIRSTERQERRQEPVSRFPPTTAGVQYCTPPIMNNGCPVADIKKVCSLTMPVLFRENDHGSPGRALGPFPVPAKRCVAGRRGWHGQRAGLPSPHQQLLPVMHGHNCTDGTSANTDNQSMLNRGERGQIASRTNGNEAETAQRSKNLSSKTIGRRQVGTNGQLARPSVPSSTPKEQR